MANSLWATLHILWKAVSSYLFLWLTGSEWHCTHFVKCYLITASPTMNRLWVTLHILWKAILSHLTNSLCVTLHILWKAVSSYLFLWLTASEWHCTFCEMLSHHILSYYQQRVSDITHLWKAVSSHLFLWLTASEWHCTFCERLSSHLFLWPTASESHCTFCKRQSHHLFSYDQQQVSHDIVHFVKGSLITFDQQSVSDIAHFVKGSLITFFPITNSKWVTLHICERLSHHIFAYD